VGLAVLKYNCNGISFARLFMVPGINHCPSGPTTNQFDMQHDALAVQISG
jgi:hypothetical protein